MKKRPLISIVSVNYNQKEHTEEFLDSVYSSGYDNLEVFIVDNASKDPLDIALETQYENLKCIFSKKNLGFAGGNNLALAETKGMYVFFLNNDTIVSKGFFSRIVSFLEKNTDIGLLSPKIVYPTGQIQFAGSIKINSFTGRGRKIGQYEEDNGQYDHISETAYAHGAAMIVRQEIIENVGPLNEDYFLYYEELDWSERIKKAGYKSIYFGETSIIHKESVSIGKASPLKTYYMNRNRILFLKNNVSGLNFLVSLLFFFIFSLPKSTVLFLLKRKIPHLKNLWRGVFWHLDKRYDFKNY